jgi:hypothetical protein
MVQGSSFVVKDRQVCVTPEKATHLFLARMVDGVPESHFVELLPQDIVFQKTRLHEYEYIAKEATILQELRESF